MSDANTLLADRLSRSKDDPFITGLDDRTYTYGEYWERARKLTAVWRDRGAIPGDVIAFALSNNAMLPCCYLSCAIGGFVALPIADTLHPDVVDHMLRSVNPKLVIDILPAPGEAAVDDAYRPARDPAGPFIIMFTSGSTGSPKAICHSLNNVVGSASAFAELTEMSPHRRFYHVLPMAYMAGFLNAMLAPFIAGAHIVEGPLFSPEAALDFWQRPMAHDVNVLQITPTIAAALCRLTRDRAMAARVGEYMDQVQCTSAPIALDIRRRFMEKFSVPLQDCYGITELGGPLTFQNRADATAFNGFTDPVRGIDLDIRKDEDNEELWIRSPFAMLGYLENGSYVRPFDADGYMDTGDLAVIGDGRVEITGRKKDIIIRGGVNVSPLRLESMLSAVPEVDEAAVVGAPHAFWGEQIVAFVVPVPGARDVREAVQRFCRERLGVGERPDEIRVLDELPRSFIGKIQKSELKQRLQET